MEEEDRDFSCHNCGKVFSYEKSFTKHVQRCQNLDFYSDGQRGSRFVGRYKCPHCESFFSRLDYLENHIKRIHPPDAQALFFSCGICSSAFPTRVELREHRETEHVKTNEFVIMSSAHKSTAVHYRYFFEKNVISLDDCLKKCLEQIPTLLETALVYNKLLKCSIVIFIEMYKTDADGEISRMETFPFRAQAFIIRPFSNFQAQVGEALEFIGESVGEFLYQVGRLD